VGFDRHFAKTLKLTTDLTDKNLSCCLSREKEEIRLIRFDLFNPCAT